MNRDDIYTSLGEAEIEIKRRNKDLVLKKKLDDFWGENKPDFIYDKKPRSVLSKSIMTPNLEFKYFMDISKEIGLDICLWEYNKGKFVGKNQEKRHLGKMFFYHGHGKKNGNKIDHTNILDFSKEEGKKMFDVNTLCGKKLVDFHHDILEKVFPNKNFNIKDISEWFDKTRYMDAYYLYYLSLFIRDNILFENFFFDGEKEETKFTCDNFLPSFKKAIEIFGCKPLIVPLLPQEHEKSHFWLSYDEKIKEMLNI
jgi:hypothetical protein